MSLPLAPDTLDRILRAAGAGPSPFDLQPWRFVVVRDPPSLRRLQTGARNNPIVGRAAAVVVVLGYLHPDRTHLDDILDARCELGFLRPEQAAESRGRALAEMALVADRSLWASRWAMTAVANLVRSAELLGVAARTVDGFDAESVRETFGVPDDHVIACLVALEAAVDKSRTTSLDLDKTCYAEHFGQPWAG